MQCSDVVMDRYALHPSCKYKQQYKHIRGKWENTDLLSTHGSNLETASQIEDPVSDSFASTDTVWDWLLPYLLMQQIQIFPLHFSVKKKKKALHPAISCSYFQLINCLLPAHSNHTQWLLYMQAYPMARISDTMLLLFWAVKIIIKANSQADLMNFVTDWN